MRTIITAGNLDSMKQQLPLDQARELEAGCVTWPIAHDTGAGSMTTWPNGRAALCLGGDSIWGDWDGRYLVTGDPGEDPIAYDVDGREVAWFTHLRRLRAAGWTNRQIAEHCGITTHGVDQWFMAGDAGRTPGAAAQKLLAQAVASIE